VTETIVRIILSRGLPRVSMLSICLISSLKLKAGTESALMQGFDEYVNGLLCWILMSSCEGLQ